MDGISSLIKEENGRFEIIVWAAIEGRVIAATKLGSFGSHQDALAYTHSDVMLANVDAFADTIKPQIEMEYLRRGYVFGGYETQHTAWRDPDGHRPDSGLESSSGVS